MGPRSGTSLGREGGVVGFGLLRKVRFALAALLVLSAAAASSSRAFAATVQFSTQEQPGREFEPSYAAQRDSSAPPLPQHARIGHAHDFYAGDHEGGDWMLPAHTAAAFDGAIEDFMRDTNKSLAPAQSNASGELQSVTVPLPPALPAALLTIPVVAICCRSLRIASMGN